MTLDTAIKISRNNSTDSVSKWVQGVGKFVSELHPKVGAAMRNMCMGCPFRDNLPMGGCIGEDCPVHLVMKSVNLAVKRAANGAKTIYKAKYMKVSA